MRTLLIVLTVIEIVLLVGALAFYLNRIGASLQRTSGLLAKVGFGVRAIESQCAPIGPVVTTINGQLATISGALAGVAELATRAGDGAGVARAGAGAGAVTGAGAGSVDGRGATPGVTPGARQGPDAWGRPDV